MRSIIARGRWGAAVAAFLLAATGTAHASPYPLGFYSNGQAIGDTGYGVSVTPDARFAAFSTLGIDPTDNSLYGNAYVKDRRTGELWFANTTANGRVVGGISGSPALSADGQRVAFLSDAPDLVDGDTNGVRDAFLKNLASGAIQRVSLDQNGAQLTQATTDVAMSDGAGVVAFIASFSIVPTNKTYVDVFVRDVAAGTTTDISYNALHPGTAANLAVSPNGRYVAWADGSSGLVAGDTNGVADVFVYDRTTQTTTRASVTSSGGEANGASSQPVVGNDGAVVFASQATNLVGGVQDANNANDVFLHDAAGSTTLVSYSTAGGFANGASTAPSMSTDEKRVVFQSTASDIVGTDANGKSDVFVRDLDSGVVTLASRVDGGAQPTADSFSVAGRRGIADDGRWVALASGAELKQGGGSGAYLVDIVPNAAPTAAFTATPGPLSVTVDAGTSTDRDGWITQYAYSFGDGATAAGSSGTHTYAHAGTYTVTLTVTDNEGLTATKQVLVTVPDAPPTTGGTGGTTGTTGGTTGGTGGGTGGTGSTGSGPGGTGGVATSAIVVRSARLRGARRLVLELTCPATAKAPGCTGTLALRAVPRHGHKRGVPSVSYALAPGARRTIVVKLKSAVARLLEARGARLKVAVPNTAPVLLAIRA